MNMFYRYIIPCLIPIFTIFYGIGDNQGLWDKIRGRADALAGLDRLLKGDGYPKAWVYENEPEFGSLTRIINQNTRNPKLRAILTEGHRPTLIAMDGGLAQKSLVPTDFPQSIFIPDSAYVLYVFENSAKEGKGKATWVGSARDLRLWIDEDRNQERFWVSTFFFSMLTIWIVIVTEKRKSNKDTLTNEPMGQETLDLIKKTGSSQKKSSARHN